MTGERWAAPRAPDAQLTIEQEIFDSLASVSQRLCVWQPQPALIATTSEANQPAFAAAAACAKNRGLPVHVRRSGGGAVCLGPGTLVVSHLYSSAHNDLSASYREFAGALMAATATVGVSLSGEHVARAYCDGRFDLAWRGLKVGGIAQRRRMLDRTAHVWIHAVLSVERQSLRYPQAVADFYSDLGSTRIADPRLTTCLADCLPPHASQQGLLQRCGAAIARAFEERTGAAALLRVD